MTNKNTFIKDFSKFFSGALLAQLLAFGLGPVLSRLFTPKDFGLFALYIQMLSPLLVFGGAGLFLLLPMNKNKETSRTVFKLTMFSSTSISLAIIILGFFNILEIEYFNSLWPYLAVGIILSNLRGFLHFQSVSDKLFLYNSKSKLIESAGGSSLNILTGYLGYNQFGLVIGNLVGQLLFITSFIVKYKQRCKDFYERQSFKSYFEFFKNNKKNIILQSFNQFIEVMLILLFSVLITKISSINELGSFVFCYKVIQTPLTLFADYFGQASLARISDLNAHSHQKKFLVKSYLLLLLPSFFLILLFQTFGVEIFLFVFGDGWEQAGLISSAYILGITSTFFIKSLQYIPNVKSRHEIYTVVSLFTFGLPVLVLLYSQYDQIDFLSSLEKLSYALAVLAIIYSIALLRLFSSKDQLS